MLQSTARLDGNQWVINGHKWLITGADGAAFAIIMAKVEGGAQAATPRCFSPSCPIPRIHIERTLDSHRPSFTGGHARDRDQRTCACRPTRVLGEVGKGFRYAQVRLAPARLTHCMRWLGSAVRAQDIAADYARKRQAFGKKLGEHEGVSFMLADNHMDIHQARLAIWHTAWLLDQGERASNESSMSKVVCSEAIARVADRSMQILGGMGITRDTVVERIFRDMRAFRMLRRPLGSAPLGAGRAHRRGQDVDPQGPTSGWWQATHCAPAISRSSGTISAHMASARGQRVRKRQPDGGASGEGGSPTARLTAGFTVGIGHGDRLEQQRRIGMRRLGEQLLGRGRPRTAGRDTSRRCGR